jgi:hypothetical protein
MRLQHLLCLTLILAPACANGAATGANLTRSPTLDYPPPPAQTSDGQVVGVDGVRPEHKLAQSPKIGNGGLTPAASPATFEEPGHDPAAVVDDPQCAGLGMKDAVRKASCHAPPAPTPKP